MKDEAATKRKQRERMRLEGYILKQIWVRPYEWPLVKRYIKRLAKRRTP